jgi:hypothetical protein
VEGLGMSRARNHPTGLENDPCEKKKGKGKEKGKHERVESERAEKEEKEDERVMQRVSFSEVRTKDEEGRRKNVNLPSKSTR